MVDIQKNLKFEEIVTDTDNRRFTSIGTVEIFDRHNELLPIDTTFKRSLDDWMSQGGVILDNHTHKPVAKALRWEHTTINHLPAIRITGEVFKNRAGDKVWDEMKKGEREGLSVGGSFLTKEEDDNGTIMRGLEINEVSIVSKTGNQGAQLEAMSMAKSNDTNVSKADDERIVVEDEKETIDLEQQDKISDLETKISNLTQMVEEIKQTVTGTPNDEVETTETKEETVEEKTETSEEVEKSESKEEPKKEENAILKALEGINSRLDKLEEVKEVKKSEELVDKDVVKTLETEEPILNKDSEVSSTSFMKDLDSRIAKKEISPEEAIQEIKNKTK